MAAESESGMKKSFYLGDDSSDDSDADEDMESDDELSTTLINSPEDEADAAKDGEDEDNKENERFYPTLYDCLSPRVIMRHVDIERMRREARIAIKVLRKRKRFYDGKADLKDF